MPSSPLEYCWSNLEIELSYNTRGRAKARRQATTCLREFVPPCWGSVCGSLSKPRRVGHDREAAEPGLEQHLTIRSLLPMLPTYPSVGSWFGIFGLEYNLGVGPQAGVACKTLTGKVIDNQKLPDEVRSLWSALAAPHVISSLMRRFSRRLQSILMVVLSARHAACPRDPRNTTV